MKNANLIPTNKITALYERLSRDDEVAGDSVSIQTQKEVLRDYAKQHGFTNCVDYADDGWSGGNFERPRWKDLVADIEAGKVSTVIVKDMSRVGRNYLQTGYYTEIYFPQNNVRFIAIANNVDSADQASAEFAPFLNIMNEWYLRDASRKQKQAYKARGKAGIPYASSPCYGYKKAPNDKHKRIVDEEAAAVVRQMFAWAAQGIGVQEIARRLRKQKVEKPSYYMATHGVRNCDREYAHQHPYDWNSVSVAYILSRPEYLGHTVNGRSTAESYKTHKHILNDPSEWQILENTHEAIIDQETFDAVQKARNVKRRTDTLGKANPLTGLVFCADCGRRMYNHRGMGKSQKRAVGPDPETGLFPKDYYACSTYTISLQRCDGVCSEHRITTKAIRTLVLNAIRAAVQFALFDKAQFIQRVREESQIETQAQAKELQKRIAKAQRRISELDRLIMKVYEDYALERIPLERYQQMAAVYEAEQRTLKEALAEDQAKADAFAEDTDRAERFIALAERYSDFSVLTDKMILEFVEKILVHTAEKVNGERVQEVEVYLTYIGKLDLPDAGISLDTASPEQQAAQREKRAYHRQYYHEKRKPKIEAQTAAG